MPRSNRSKSAQPRKLVRYAVVGLGHIAQAAVLPAFKHARRNSRLVGLISGEPRKLRSLGRRYAVPHLCSYEDAEELFRSGEVDAVYIALPNDLHREWTIRAARAGLHVLCEKPMAATVRDCEAMIGAARKAGVKLMIAYRLHFERANLEVAQLLRSGKLGETKFFSSDFSMQVKPGNIRVTRREGGGPLYDIGVYCINAARYCFGAEPVEVFATAIRSNDARFRKVDETVAATLLFEDDRVATFTCSFGAADRATFTVTGNRGSVTMEPAYEYAMGLCYRLRIGERTRVKNFAKSDQFAPELVYFSNCILRNREPEPSGEEGLADLRIIESLQRSIASGRSVAVKGAQRKRRPTLRQSIRRPAVARAPKLVKAASASK